MEVQPCAQFPLAEITFLALPLKKIGKKTDIKVFHFCVTLFDFLIFFKIFSKYFVQDTGTTGR